MGRLRSERGSVTVFAVGVLLLGFLLVVALAGVGQVLIARSRVVTAAEAGALASAPGNLPPLRRRRLGHRRGGPAGQGERRRTAVVFMRA